MLASKQRILWTIPKDPKFSWIVPLDSRNRRSWSVMRDHELLRFARKFMEEEGIRGRKELEKSDSVLYQTLKKRRLLDEIIFERKQRNWESMSDEELVRYVRKFMEEEGITGKGELKKADNGVYIVLRKRGLLDKLWFEEKRRDWNFVSDEELVRYAKKFMEERGISGRSELKKTDSGLYNVLRKRKLSDEVGFEEKWQKRRNWKSISDKRLLRYTKEFIEERGIIGRTELKKSDGGLYEVLRIRKLLDAVFAPIDQSRRKEAILQVVEAMEEFAC
ncbi:hypothetical protein KKB44_06260 [Candidatus Micrarchaeota archaeon]|nr:hypothetical protein [Candidatus Micrarchaeota archaeon]